MNILYEFILPQFTHQKITLNNKEHTVWVNPSPHFDQFFICVDGESIKEVKPRRFTFEYDGATIEYKGTDYISDGMILQSNTPAPKTIAQRISIPGVLVALLSIGLPFFLDLLFLKIMFPIAAAISVLKYALSSRYVGKKGKQFLWCLLTEGAWWAVVLVLNIL